MYYITRKVLLYYAGTAMVPSSKESNTLLTRISIIVTFFILNTILPAYYSLHYRNDITTYQYQVLHLQCRLFKDLCFYNDDRTTHQYQVLRLQCNLF